MLPTYKGSRDYSKRPEYLSRIKDYLEANWPSYRRDRLEADDIMGILSTHPSLVKGRKVIVSEDKDMKTIPGWLYNPAKDFKPRLISEAEADRFHLYQTLIGDTTDGYTGCPGVGKDHKRLKGYEGPIDWDMVVELYATKKRTEEDALVQARVARICRASDFDFATKTVKLWLPGS